MTAITFIGKQAQLRRDTALGLIRNVQQMSAIATPRLNHGLLNLAQHARIAFHFHPDRLDYRGWPVIAGLLSDGEYRSQFETRTSNGKLQPQLGGVRDHWENALFGHCYVGAKSRPKYGALDIGLHQSGPAARFGSCYLLSAPALLGQCTFCYLDSCRNPREKGTLACFEDVFAALFNEAFERDSALGVRDFRPPALVQYLCEELPRGVDARFLRPMSRDLDHYIEAQYHGGLLLMENMEVLVADPSYRHTATETIMQRLCERYQIRLCWHQGFQMPAANVPADFRGSAMPPLAAQVAREGILTPALLGEAEVSLRREPERWRRLGSEAELLQQLKLLWHVLVRFGAVGNPP
ncbi:DUF3626 domain-containing protein [Shewanella sp. YIC-542]|uniref:DUF3626 domain-containing protein n=1 Tax=Shewanella mytili TaxID=3377111 RepID=UPI00398E809D